MSVGTCHVMIFEGVIYFLDILSLKVLAVGKHSNVTYEERKTAEKLTQMLALLGEKSRYALFNIFLKFKL